MNSTIKHPRLWTLWLLSSLFLAAYLGMTLTEAEDKTLLMPGPLSDGHHQFADDCSLCHSDAYGGGKVLQEACVDCHGDDRVKPFDSHPRAKFTDPRNADRLEHINALECVSCHTEHRPEITAKNGVTQPKDLCFHCHENVAENRPSHIGMPMDTCANSGCHNFHNNRALYTEFLTKRMDDPANLDRQKVPGKEFGNILEELFEYPRDRYPMETLVINDADAPANVALEASEKEDWLTTAHAKQGVNCSACHVPVDESGAVGEWLDHPPETTCALCHDLEVKQFGKGKHGMRLAAGLSPMKVEDARLPMHDDPAHAELTCNSCHPAHRFEPQQAAVEACLGCHTDEHSLAYKSSPHYELWQQEVAGELPPNSGVSCATCHLPRVEKDINDWMSRIVVDHNQSASLAPNSKMMRPACLHCHGLPFAIDALADPDLILNNFNGYPQVHIESVDLARKDLERYLQERNQ